ncbi:MAG: hypothetical protein QM639_09785 [Rhodocyclaceae bacterium]
MMIIPTENRLTAAAACIGVLLVLVGVQTWRLHALEADYAKQSASIATSRADRAQAYAKDSDETATKEHAHAAATLKAADQFTAGAVDRDTALVGQLADARRLLNDADRRAASYRAQATNSAEACSRLADRSESLDRSLAAGRLVVAELRGVVEQRDVEVKLLSDLLDADERLLGSE